MKARDCKHSMRLPAILCTVLLAAAAASAAGAKSERRTLPWRQAGMTERQAAAHLLDRFTFGARPGDVDRLVEQGLEAWLAEQLAAQGRDPMLERYLSRLDAWSMEPVPMAQTFPHPGVVRRKTMMAQKETDADESETFEISRADMRRYARDSGLRPQYELIRQLWLQRLWRALHSKHQLQAVLQSFWYNHFNVSSTDTEVRAHLLSYDRDAILRSSLGRFEDLLGRTAAHPAMLLYLDNARSTVEEGMPTMLSAAMSDQRQRPSTPRRRRSRASLRRDDRGLNENYARELLELHTLGVDGGYTEKDVREVARAFSGWGVVPAGAAQERMRQRQASGRGPVPFLIRDNFVFRADAHDAGRKVVLGHDLPAGRGMEDGLEVLEILARHPSTARHVSYKLAQRFVADDPSPALVGRLAQVYLESAGEIRSVVEALAYSPEFWQTRRAKIKSPSELIASSLRAVDAEVLAPWRLMHWLELMGQPLFACDSPAGYPEEGEHWISAGALLTRMNFATQLATGEMPGVRLGPKPSAASDPRATPGDSLQELAALLLPERDLEPTLGLVSGHLAEAESAEQEGSTGPRAALWASEGRALALLLGSPEFQRR